MTCEVGYGFFLGGFFLLFSHVDGFRMFWARWQLIVPACAVHPMFMECDGVIIVWEVDDEPYILNTHMLYLLNLAVKGQWIVVRFRLSISKKGVPLMSSMYSINGV